jgi:hypothetical protein
MRHRRGELRGNKQLWEKMLYEVGLRGVYFVVVKE